MRRSLGACVALLLACNPAQPGPDSKAGTKDAPAKPADAKTPTKPETPAEQEPPAKPEAPKPEAPAEPETPPVEPAEPVAAAPLPPATTALLDRLVPAAERVVVDEAAAKRLKIKAEENQLWVVDGTRRASLGQRGDAVHGVTVVKGAGGEPVLKIEFEDSVFCGDTRRTVELPARGVLAKLEHAAGTELLTKAKAKADGEAAVRAFAQAVLLDPTIDDAWFDLARALPKDDPASAMAALEPMLARAPVKTYHRVQSAPELKPLREQPAIAALRAPKAGDVKLAKLSTIAHSAHLSMVALRRQEQSWGACNYVEDLRLFDTAKGELVLTLPLVGWTDAEGECDEKGTLGKIEPAQRAEVKARMDAAERLLRDMGFTVSEKLELVDPQKSPGDVFTKVELPGAGLEVLMTDTSISLRKDDKELVSKPQDGAESIDLVGHDPEARVVFVEWWLSVPEGCAFDGDGRGHYVLPVPASP